MITSKKRGLFGPVNWGLFHPQKGGVIGNYNYIVFGNQEYIEIGNNKYIVFGNKRADKSATRNTELCGLNDPLYGTETVFI